MKLFKIALLILTIAIITDLGLAYAYPSPTGTGYSFELNKNNGQYTSYRTKINYNVQKYQNIGAFTVLTNPCPACQILSKPYTESGNVYAGTVTVTGEESNLTHQASYPDDFRLLIKRNDTTLLTTYHSGFWTMN